MPTSAVQLAVVIVGEDEAVMAGPQNPGRPCIERGSLDDGIGAPTGAVGEQRTPSAGA